MEEEIWKDIYYYNEPTNEWVDYRGLYQVSNLGRVRSLDRIVNHNYSKHLTIKGKIIKPYSIKGYLNISLSNNGVVKKYYIHHLVAKMFIPNYTKRLEINHKDENKTNNKVENLEWISHINNCNYGTRNMRCGELKKIPITQYDKSNNKINDWGSITECSKKLGIDAGSISKCCKGRLKTYKGFIWRYKEKEAV